LTGEPAASAAEWGFNRDGMKFLEVEVLEVKQPATIDESEVAKP
jgi:hypothetical protein